MLRGYYDLPLEITVNPTVRGVLAELKQKGYTNIILSNKSAVISREKAKITGLEDLFDDFFDARGLPNCKSTLAVQLKYGLNRNEIADKAIYFGDDLDNDLIYDTNSLVQVFDAAAMTHDFRIFTYILDYLNGKDNKSFKRAYEELGVEKKEMKGIIIQKQQFNLPQLLAMRENKSDYENKTIQQTAYVLQVEAVEEKLCTAPVLPSSIGGCNDAY